MGQIQAAYLQDRGDLKGNKQGIDRSIEGRRDSKSRCKSIVGVSTRARNGFDKAGSLFEIELEARNEPISLWVLAIA